MLGALRQQQAADATTLEALQARWAEAGFAAWRPMPMPLADRWDALPPALRTMPAVVAAYARRAAAMGWHDAASGRLEDALDAGWDRIAGRALRQPARWRGSSTGVHASSSGCRRVRRIPPCCCGRPRRPATGHWLQADAWCIARSRRAPGRRRGNVWATARCSSATRGRARQAYANALRSQRGEPVVDLAGRDLRQLIADNAAVEERDAHGLPRLRGVSRTRVPRGLQCAA